ncbi:hypothetical protein HK413_03395 [Mucilaginibacter sp. S1162]|uniref:Carboxypeptidase regulatory-like domain-containing protein n=1 Tax=Mucilaginibacter humi TaxID=2732510 RepID=A0ABX1VZQ9_9SPHI|nr:hypothetical protein [Mucilaginibacter humi]NNU33444.1 hypothetical protein [Mucilaginibacter humi]
MKYYTLLFIVLAFAGCTGNNIEINGTADGIANGTITVKDASGQTLSGVNLKDGTFHVAKTHRRIPVMAPLYFPDQARMMQALSCILRRGSIPLNSIKLSLAPIRR